MAFLTVLTLFSLILSSKVSAVTRIIGGSDAPEGAYPYHIGIKYDNLYLCGGSILNKRWILTAAHCLIFGLEKYNILAGTTLLNDTNGQIYYPDKFVLHENFNLFRVLNDIALIHVDRDVEFSDKVKPIALPKENFKVNYYVTLTGWGYDNVTLNSEGVVVSGTSPNKLQYLIVKTISKTECKNYTIGAGVSDLEMCTLSKKGYGACHTDSGSPLVADDNVQIGILSMGECALGTPYIYTNVYEYVDWINEQMTKFENNTLLLNV